MRRIVRERRRPDCDVKPCGAVPPDKLDFWYLHTNTRQQVGRNVKLLYCVDVTPVWRLVTVKTVKHIKQRPVHVPQGEIERLLCVSPPELHKSPSILQVQVNCVTRLPWPPRRRGVRLLSVLSVNVLERLFGPTKLQEPYFVIVRFCRRSLGFLPELFKG